MNTILIVFKGPRGPFLIYINDFRNSSAKFSFYLFADDINLLYADKNLKSLEQTVNNELVKVSDWLDANIKCNKIKLCYLSSLPT